VIIFHQILGYNPEEDELIQENNWKRKFYRFYIKENQIRTRISLHAIIADKQIESENKPKQIMILLHGFPEFWYSWRFIIPELSKHFHVIALDQRGFNYSTKPKSIYDYGLDKLAIDVIRVLKQESREYYVNQLKLDPNSPIVTKPKAIIVGHDWGGGLSWQIARWFPDYVSKLVILNCPPVDVLMGEAVKNIQQLLKSYYIYLFQIPVFGELFFSKLKYKSFREISKLGKIANENSDFNAYKHAYSYVNANRAINWYRATMLYILLGRIKLKKNPMIKCCTKVIWGTNDSALDINLVKGFYKIVEKGKLSIKLLDGISHWVQQQAPESVLSELKAFLEY
jgi:pimeloyl-ACP methyl ester carboxylesterase